MFYIYRYVYFYIYVYSGKVCSKAKLIENTKKITEMFINFYKIQSFSFLIYVLIMPINFN